MVNLLRKALKLLVNVTSLVRLLSLLAVASMQLQPELNEKARRQVSSMYLNLRKSQIKLDDLERTKVVSLKILDNKQPLLLV